MWSRFVRRTVLVVATVTAIALLLVAVAHLPFVRARVLEWARGRISQEFGIALTADDLAYNLFAVSVELRHPTLSAPAERPFFQADTVRLVLDRHLFVGTVDVTRLELVRPRVTIVRHRDGTTNLPTVPSSPSSQPTPIHLGILALNQLSVDLADEGGGHHGTAGPIDLTLDTRAGGGVPGRFGPSPFSAVVSSGEPASTRSIAGTFGGQIGFDGERLAASDIRIDTAEGQLAVSGWIDLIAETIRVDARGRFETDLSRASRLMGIERALTGAATADITVRGAVADPTVHILASAHDFHVQPFPPATADGEATYAAGRLQIQRLDVRTPIGTATAIGVVRLVPTEGPPHLNQVHAALADVDVDRLLEVAGVRPPLQLGSTAAGDVDVTLDAPNPFTAEWWRQLTANGTLQFSPSAPGVGIDGRVDLRASGGHWSIEHRLRSTAAGTTMSGAVSGDITQSAGTFDSTVAGQSRIHIDAVHAVTPFLRQAGLEVPAQLAELDGVVDAVVRPRGTFAAPRVLASIVGRDIRLADLSEGQIESTLVLDRRSARVESLQARLGPAAATASGTYSWSGQIASQFTVTADDLAAAARVLGGGDMPVAGAARLAGSLRGTITSLSGTAELTARDLSAYDVAVGPVSAQLRLAGKQIDIEAAAPHLNALVHGSIAVSEPYRYQAEARLDRSSIAALFPASVLDQVPAEGIVTTTLKAQGNLSRLAESTGELSLEALDGAIARVPVVLDGPATISVDANALTVTPTHVHVGESTDVRLQGTLGLNEIRSGLDVRATGPLPDLLAIAAPAFPDTRIESDQSAVTLDLHVGGTLLAPGPTGTLTATAAAVRYANQPPAANVALAARIEPTGITVQSVAAEWLGATLRGEGTLPFRMVAPEPSSSTGTTGIAAWGSQWLASLPAEPRSARATGRLTGITTDALAPFVEPSTLQAVAGNVDATVNLEADGFALERVRGSLVLDQASVIVADVPLTQSVPTRIRLEQGRAEIEDFRWNAESNELRVSGGATLLPADRRVDLAVNGDLDLRILGAFVSGIATSGIAHSELTVKGPITAPEVVGSLRVTSGELRVDNPSFAASDVEGTIVIPPDRYASIFLSGSVNGGTASVSGQISLQEFTAPTGQLVLTARNVTLDYPEGFQTESNADLVLTLDPSESSVTGYVDLLSGLYREPLVISRTLLSGLGSTPGVTTASESSLLAKLALDITVTTAEQIRVDNNYGRLNLTANLQVTGTAAQPGVIGRIDAEPDGEIYFAGNTYRVESLVIDLANPRTIAPDVTFLAETRVGSVPIEIALQCSAAGQCEREVRSQASGVSNEEAEALLFGVSGGTTEAGAQLARVLSGELLGIVGQSFRLDTLRLEQAAGRADLFDDPTLVAGDVNPASRLTIGKRLGEHVELAYSQNLARAGFTMSTSYFAPAGISARALLLDDQSRAFEFRHEPRFGGPRRNRSVTTEAVAVAGVRFTGDPGFPESDLRGQLHLTDGDRFAFAEWQADRERLIAFYQSRGFFEARVRPRRMLPSGEPLESAATNVQSIVLEYAIQRGRPTRLDISGFDVPDRIRQRIITRWASAVFDGFLERDAALIVREYLYAENRLQAKVTAAVERSAAGDAKTLRIAIDPGPVTRPALVFEGNSAIPTGTLLAASERAGPLAAWLDSTSFGLMITQLYHEEGLLSAEVTVQPPHVQQDVSEVRVVIREGEPWSVGRVTVDGASVLDGESIDRLGLSADGRFTPKTVADAISTLEQQLRDAGFLSAHVTADNTLETPARRVNVHVVAVPGPRTVLTSVSIEGSASTRAAVERHIALEPGAPVSASELRTTRQRLYETGTYRSVDIDLEPVEQPGRQDAGTAAGQRNVVARIRVEERPRYTLRYGLAFNDDVVGPDERNRKIGFAADVTNRNVMGLGATLGLSARLRRDQEVGRLYVGVPSFFGLPLRSTMFLSRSREDIGTSELSKGVADVTDFTGEQRYRLRRLIDLRYGYNLEFNRTTFENFDFDLTVRVARLTTSASIDRRDDPFDPSRGSFSSANFELSRTAIGSQLNFAKSFIQHYQFFSLPHGIVIGSAARLGVARTFRDEFLQVRERFKAGGPTTVRGYHDDDLGQRSTIGDADGGAALFIANGEVRFPIYRWLRGVAFTDLGNVYEFVSDLRHPELQVGSGGGFRLNTPVGLLRLDLAAPINRRAIDPMWTVHVGLGHAF